MRMNTDAKKNDNNHLAHHGIKGMKWGVRRYQNKDGSLTNKGMRRGRYIQTCEDLARESTSHNPRSHTKAVISKYETFKNDSQRKADRDVDRASRDLNKTMSLFNSVHTALGSKKYIQQQKNLKTAELNRAKVYAGEKWVNKYVKDLKKAQKLDTKEYRKLEKQRGSERTKLKDARRKQEWKDNGGLKGFVNGRIEAERKSAEWRKTHQR